ncbi:MAG: pyridoxal phosphate-dependent aminotransferase, partial [Ignavibacteriaceae bacterium]|nr:pyridoxal phosphate-dependent aminotransferase [Ignavibacteriaceae bacterium]
MANNNPFEKLFKLKPIRPGKISEISEATASSSVPLAERVNFHIGNPIQSEILSNYYLRSILNLPIDSLDDSKINIDSIREELDWDQSEIKRIEFLYELIQNSAPYSPRGGYSINKPIKLIQKFHRWLENDQEEPLSYDLGERSGKREIIISSGGRKESLRVLFHSLNSYLQNLPANIFISNSNKQLYENSFHNLKFHSIPEFEKDAYSSLAEKLAENLDVPNYLILDKSFSEETRRNIRELAFKYPLYIIEINDTPNHFSLAREAKLKSSVLRILTPFFILNKLKNSSVVFLAGDSELLRIYESVHFQLKGTPSSSEIELLQYLVDNKDEINESSLKLQLNIDHSSLDQSSAFPVPSLIYEKSKSFEKMTERVLSRTDKILSRMKEYLNDEAFSLLRNSSIDYLAVHSTKEILDDLFKNISDDNWHALTAKSLINVFTKEHPYYDAKYLEVVNGSARTALGILGFHCGIQEIITCDFSWTYEHCFPKTNFIPLKDDFELDVEGISRKVISLLDKKFQKNIAVIFNNPHNASGKIFKETDIKRLLAFCLDNNVYVIDDLAYQNVLPDNSIKGPKTVKQIALDLVNEGQVFREQLKNVISIHSLSKTDSFAGARIAFAEIIDDELRKSFCKYNSYIKPNIAANILAYLFYRNDSERIKLFWLLRNKIFKAKMDAIKEAEIELPESRNPFGIHVSRPQGSMYPLMTIDHLPHGLSLDWLSSGLASQGIGIIPLSAFARSSKGFELGRKSFRLTLGGTDSPEVLLRKTRRVLIDLNRLIAEEEAKYNKHLFPVKKVNRKNHFYFDSSDFLWQQFTASVEQECRRISYQAVKNFTDENESKIISERFFEKYLPARLAAFTKIFESSRNMYLDFLSSFTSEKNSTLVNHLESEFYKDNLEQRQKVFKERTYDRTVHPTQVFAIDTDILFNSAFDTILKKQNPDKAFINRISKCLIDEYLGKNVSINSAKEGEELVCDLKAMIHAENFASIYSNNYHKEIMSFWGDWDGSNRPSGQGHRLVAAALIENVIQLSSIIKTIISIDSDTNIDSNLLSQIDQLQKSNQDFWQLLNHITALTNQLEN